MISITENSNKFQKTMFWNEKLVKHVVTLGPTAQVTLVKMMRSNVSMQILELQLS
jgi:hypothetical protein